MQPTFLFFFFALINFYYSNKNTKTQKRHPTLIDKDERSSDNSVMVMKWFTDLFSTIGSFMHCNFIFYQSGIISHFPLRNAVLFCDNYFSFLCNVNKIMHFTCFCFKYNSITYSSNRVAPVYDNIC